jgi:hypothetical protein
LARGARAAANASSLTSKIGASESSSACPIPLECLRVASGCTTKSCTSQSLAALDLPEGSRATHNNLVTVSEKTRTNGRIADPRGSHLHAPAAPWSPAWPPAPPPRLAPSGAASPPHPCSNRGGLHIASLDESNHGRRKGTERQPTSRSAFPSLCVSA